MRMGWRNVWAAVVAVGLGVSGVAQTSAPPEKDDLFAGTEKFAQGATSVTQIDMDPDSLGKVEGKDGLKARRMVLSVVHTYEYDKPGMYRIEDVEAFRKKLETGDWHCSVHIREMKTGESTDVCNKRRDDGLREEAIITVEPKSLTFIHTIGRAVGVASKSGLVVPSDVMRMMPDSEGQMAVMGTEMQAEMAVLGAEMKAEMATVRPQLEGLKSFKAPDAEEMNRLGESLRGLDGVKGVDK